MERGGDGNPGRAAETMANRKDKGHKLTKQILSSIVPHQSEMVFRLMMSSRFSLNG